MIKLRKANDRGPTRISWLDSKHSFSFGSYYDPEHMGFGPLRVINEDRVTPGAGFHPHGHRDMEIISYVLDGALEHKDSIGTGSVIRPGDVQRMTAGTGIQHSEFNHSKQDPVHFLQIWIQPDTANLEPGYEQKSFTSESKRGKLKLVGSRDGREDSVTIHQDVNLYVGLFDRGERDAFKLDADRKAWVQVARGQIRLNDQTLEAGDGASITDLQQLEIEGLDDAEVLLFDLGGVKAA